MAQQTKHQEVRERVLAEVVATMAPDDMLPTERQLSERFGVSRMTVRQALNGLLADGSPMCHEEVFLPASRFPGLLAEDLTHSLYAVLDAKYGVRLRRAQQRIRAMNVDARLAELLGVEPNSAALLVTRISTDE